ncbi:hypothetical protein QVD17_11737 [Tagetes erecta]|uniref:RBR-type E3 ubiquitin transferase n=1 Tax=Tagetes erecta TaxID=13708 RepID=A0AAD8P2G2_TARER|nr:hypothetical protein QVD17_11737 [Tagetes erecta]
MEVNNSDQLFSDELIAAVGANSGIDFAFQLQMQEAIRASLTSSSSSNDVVFRVYFKGLVSTETVSKIKMSFAGIGVAICDANDCCLHQSRKSFLLDSGGRGTETDLVELEALIQALNLAVDLELNRVIILCDCNSIYQYLTGERLPTNNKIVTLVDKLNLIRGKFVYYHPIHVNQNDIKFVYKLARNAINSEVKKWANSDSDVAITEPCKICFEYFCPDKLFSVKKCLHRYCFSCMRKHVEAKLLQGKLPQCPYEKCESNIRVESCKTFLKPESYVLLRSRVKEASIPLADKLYCPFSDCSALMSITEVKEHTPSSSSSSSGMRQCVECQRHFCVNCKVPWHNNFTCIDYMKSSLFKSSNEAKLKSLATTKEWRECIRCKNLVELAKGCYHIYCRCGHEFCYKCGAAWINKTPTCKCRLWDEHNIIYAQRR